MTRLKPSLRSRWIKLPLVALAALIAALTIFTTASATPVFARDASAPWTGVDFSAHGHLDPQAFKKAGVDFVVRYLAGGKSPWKEITHAESDMWARAGVGVVLVWQTTASRPSQGYQAGYTDASKAFPQATSMGMPDGKPVYFAVDYDADPRAVEAYFKGIHDWAQTNFPDGKATPRIGVYGGHDVVKYIYDRGYAKYKWQAKAWMHGKGWQADAMHQHSVNVTLAGVTVDWNRVFHGDYGVWFSTCVVNPPKKQSETPAPTPTSGPALPIS